MPPMDVVPIDDTHDGASSQYITNVRDGMNERNNTRRTVDIEQRGDTVGNFTTGGNYISEKEVANHRTGSERVGFMTKMRERAALQTSNQWP